MCWLSPDRAVARGQGTRAGGGKKDLGRLEAPLSIGGRHPESKRDEDLSSRTFFTVELGPTSWVGWVRSLGKILALT